MKNKERKITKKINKKGRNSKENKNKKGRKERKKTMNVPTIPLTVGPYTNDFEENCMGYIKKLTSNVIKQN